MSSIWSCQATLLHRTCWIDSVVCTGIACLECMHAYTVRFVPARIMHIQHVLYRHGSCIYSTFCTGTDHAYTVRFVPARIMYIQYVLYRHGSCYFYMFTSLPALNPDLINNVEGSVVILVWKVVAVISTIQATFMEKPRLRNVNFCKFKTIISHSFTIMPL